MARTPLRKAVRLAVIERDGLVCGICSADVIKEQLTVDHVLPLTRGGTDAMENLQVAHRRCNSTKDNRLPGEVAECNRGLVRVDVRMSPELRKRIRRAALENDVSMGEWLRRLAERELERSDTP